MKVVNFVIYILAFLLILKVIKGVFAIREGFSYQNCMSQGYTKSFWCKTTMA